MATVCATLEAFCPIATYTQTKSPPFWLIIVSIAIIDFPVDLSPIISSLWPLPIGIMPSTALMPVAAGVFTGLLEATSGATISAGMVSVTPVGPLPSIGSPSESTTRPISFSPTATSIIFPVLRTSDPSCTDRGSSRITAPTESSSRFIARPVIPPSNSSSSE